MTQKDRELLIRDLCARLPYVIKCSFGVDDAVYEITGINPTCCGASEIQATHVESSINGDFRLNSCKPYLFPISSITEKQKTSYNFLKYSVHANPIKLIDWYNKNHIDYRGLIPMGLAIDATNLNVY